MQTTIKERLSNWGRAYSPERETGSSPLYKIMKIGAVIDERAVRLGVVYREPVDHKDAAIVDKAVAKLETIMKKVLVGYYVLNYDQKRCSRYADIWRKDFENIKTKAENQVEEMLALAECV